MLTIGDKAPDFKAYDKDGKEHRLSDYLGQKVILYFYPKDNTPGCTTEACDLRDRYEFLQAQGYTIIGVSKDTQKSHQKFAEKNALPFLLLADPEKEILEAYGVLVEKKMYGKLVKTTQRSTFIIDEKGTITHVLPKVNAKTHIQDLLELLGL